jgi:hypothetical protein
MKKSEHLAVENIRRITEQLRSERNEAFTTAQMRREQLETAKDLLRELLPIIEQHASSFVSRAMAILEPEKK